LRTPAQRISKGPWSLHNGLSSSTLTLKDPPTGTFRIVAQVVAAGAKRHKTCAGSISITGSGSTETLDFTTTNEKHTSKTFLTAKPEVTVSGLDCTIIITAVDKNGQTILQETVQDIKCGWDGSSARIQIDSTSWELCTSEMRTASFCQVGDVIRKDGKDYEVVKVKEHSKGRRVFLYRAWLAG
jgi:hypothetical protein